MCPEPKPSPHPGQVTREAISAICKNYRAGDPDPREPGTGMQVQFKEFALDFDNFVVPQEAANPNPNPSATPTPTPTPTPYPYP